VRGQRRRRILLSFEGLLSRGRRLPSRSSHIALERERELAVCPAKLFPREDGQIFTFSHGKEARVRRG
jgi:hypothetical protein